MNVMILTARFGQGHCSAAAALREQVLTRQPDAHVATVDLMEALFPSVQRAIYGGFGLGVRCCPAIYNRVGGMASRRGMAPFAGIVMQRLHALLAAHDPELVISTFPACSQYMAAYFARFGKRMQLYTYVTDIQVHGEWVAPGTDRYYVGAADTRAALAALGVPEERIRISGIPVRSAFHDAAEPPRKQERKEILILGGGLGLIPQQGEFLKQLSACEEVHVTLIAGKNRRLVKKLRRRYPGMETLGFTDRIAEYYHRADLVVTKAGGITTFEAIAAGTPLLVLRPFLVQEVGNAEFIERSGIGQVVWSRSVDLAKNILQLVQRQDRVDGMRRNMAHLAGTWQSACPLDGLEELEAVG